MCATITPLNFHYVDWELKSSLWFIYRFGRCTTFSALGAYHLASLCYSCLRHRRVSSFGLQRRPVMIATLGSRWPQLLSVLGYPEATLNTYIVYFSRERRPNVMHLHNVKILSCYPFGY